VHHADGDRLHALLAEGLHRRAHLALVERLDYAAVVRDAAAHLDAPFATGRRKRLGDVEVEGMRTALPGKLEHVAESAGGDHARACALALEHRVGAQRGAEHKKSDALGGQASQLEDLGDAVEHRAGRLSGGGGQLVVRVAPAGGITQHEVGERAAGVDSDQ